MDGFTPPNWLLDIALTRMSDVCSACGNTGPNMQDWWTPEGEVCEPCYQARHPEEYKRELEEYDPPDYCEHCGRDY